MLIEGVFLVVVILLMNFPESTAKYEALDDHDLN
jgi:hypothetical protein